MDHTLAIVMAGGTGERLLPLTRERAKPAVPFGGKFRLIDFTLSNCVNSGIRQIFVLMQYRLGSLQKHIQEGWAISSSGLGDFIYSVPAQQKAGTDWYNGTADAIRQNLDLIRRRKDIERVLILSGDHVYKMNYLQMLHYHMKHNARLSIAAARATTDEAAGKLGVLEADADYRITDFEEKPLRPKAMVNSPGHSLASMGVYIFDTSALIEAVTTPGDDFGRHIIPKLINDGLEIYAYDFEKENHIEDSVIKVTDGKREKILVDRTRDSAYWRDVGTIDTYYEASMDLLAVEPLFNLYGDKWPFRTYQRPLPPSKCIIGGVTLESIVCDGCIVSGGLVRRSILSPGVIVERDALVEDSIIFDDVIIEPRARIRRAIIDKETIVRSGVAIGYNAETDKRRGCTVSDAGITIVPKALEIVPA